MALLIIAVNKETYRLVRQAISNEVNSLESFYHDKVAKVNKKPVDEKIIERTLKEIQVLQDFAIEMDRRYEFR